jgi:hypothetical protein
MSAKTLETIEAKRLAVAKQQKSFELNSEIGILADLPPPSTPADVDDVNYKFNEESREFVQEGLKKLSAGTVSESIPWDTALYALFCAWIVNFGHDTSKPHEDAPLPPSLAARAIIDPKQCQVNILAAAAHLKLDWIMFVDLALVGYSESPVAISGPFAGVFVGRGPAGPFMILSFKGTTYQKEVNTDADATATVPRDGILYGERVHNGMQRGLFNKFEVLDKDAFEIIWEDLELVGADLKEENDGKNVPLYVTGHSLGAGYATLAYVELIRRLNLRESSPRSYDLKDLWSIASPRTGRNSFAAKVEEVMAATPDRHIYRLTRFHDIVPTVPPLYYVPGTDGYKHVGEGWKLSPDEEDYVVPRKNEVGTTIENDPKPNSMEEHWPWIYYAAVLKVLRPN